MCGEWSVTQAIFMLYPCLQTFYCTLRCSNYVQGGGGHGRFSKIPAPDLILYYWETRIFLVTGTRAAATSKLLEIHQNDWLRMFSAFKLTTIPIKVIVVLSKCVCGLVYLQAVKKTALALCANYSYLGERRYTHASLCAFYLYVCVCTSSDSLAFPYFKRPAQYKGQGPAQHDCL